LLLINKVTLAPYVEANTELMESDTKNKRPVKPFYFTDLKAGAGVSDLEKWFRHYVLFTDMDE
jgi:urease accessory protein